MLPVDRHLHLGEEFASERSLKQSVSWLSDLRVVGGLLAAIAFASDFTASGGAEIVRRSWGGSRSGPGFEGHGLGLLSSVAGVVGEHRNIADHRRDVGRLFVGPIAAGTRELFPFLPHPFPFLSRFSRC